MVRESFNHQVKHLVSLQYSTAELRHLALEDVLAGPERLHGELATKLAEINAMRKQYADAQLAGRPGRLPRGAPQEAAEARPGRDRDAQGQARASWSRRRQRRSGRRCRSGPWPSDYPEARARRAWTPSGGLIAQFDSVVVSMPDGTGALVPPRPGATSATCCGVPSRSTSGSTASGRRWPRSYRQALPDITSPEQWEKTFAASPDERRPRRTARP